MAVDKGYADWLQNDALYVTAAPANAANWTAQGITSQSMSCLALQADAATEVARQAAFLQGPLATERAVVAGHRRDLLGKPATLTGGKLGYQAVGGVTVFVLGTVENDNGTTTLTVLKRLT